MTHEILVVDDEADIRTAIRGLLEDEDYQTREADGDEACFAALNARLPSLMILDVWLQGSGRDGLAILAEARRRYPELPVVMISGHGTIEMAVDAIRRGAYDFIEKPFKSDRLLLLVERAIDDARLRREVAELRLRTGAEADLVGHSPAIVQLRTQIGKVAPTNSRILITGPAGAGKEVAARMVHRQSSRARGAFVALNCASMHPDRLGEELFGLESVNKGRRKLGTLELAHGGTLLLDEVADMPLATQSKIVRVLQDQTFTRVGGSERIRVDVRVIATSSRDLMAAIADGQFREDLFYRLSVVPLTVPALSDHNEDIPDLVDHFMSRAAQTQGRPVRRLTGDAYAALQAYAWPGSVRQLRNVVEWLLIMAPGETDSRIRADMLPPEVGEGASALVGWSRNGDIMALPLREARDLFEREYLVAQVTRYGGNISRTAEFVGMERSALHRKLKSLGVANTKSAAEGAADG